MGLRLRRWWHRDAVPAGRHVRVLPVVSVPGAASTLMSSAGLDPRVTGTYGVAPAVDQPTMPVPVVPVPSPTDVMTAPSPMTVPLPPAPVLPAPGPDGRHDDIAAVGLVFADGASVELEPDDPRVRTFRAAAAALLDPPSA